MNKFRTIYTKVAGVTKKNDSGDSIQELLEEYSCAEAESLDAELERDSYNEYDDNAIKVMCDYTHIGYINRSLAADLACYIDDGGQAECRITEITGGDDKNYGCNLEITVSAIDYERAIQERDAPPPIKATLEPKAQERREQEHEPKRKEVSKRQYKINFWLGLISSIVFFPFTLIAAFTAHIIGVIILCINILLFLYALKCRKRAKE